MPKNRIDFLVADWLTAALDNFANTHKLKDDDGTYNKTTVLHWFIKELIDMDAPRLKQRNDALTFEIEERKKYEAYIEGLLIRVNSVMRNEQLKTAKAVLTAKLEIHTDP